MKGNVFNNHKPGKEDIHGKGYMNYNYLSGSSPTCLMDAGNNTYNHDDYEEHPFRHYCV
jgi:hypothetical protein